MLKKLYQKDGLIIVFNEPQPMDLCYSFIKYINDKDINDKDINDKIKNYYIDKGYKYKSD
jgi:hypothetical protein